MKNLIIKTTLLIATTLTLLPLHAAIYGNDDRLNISAIKDQNILDISESIAARISIYQIVLNLDNLNDLIVDTRTLNYGKYCKDQNFHDEPTGLAGCTGFLIGEKLLMTAGHCIKNELNCIQNYWVFGFNKSGIPSFSSDDIYTCKRIVKLENNLTTKNDYAIIELDRATDRPYLALTAREIIPNEELYSIGFPSGQSMKIAMHGKAKSKFGEYSFQHNLDLLHGNSGSPIFTADNKVIGITSAGKEDYVRDSTRNCFMANVCDEDGENCLAKKSKFQYEIATKISLDMFNMPQD